MSKKSTLQEIEIKSVDRDFIKKLSDKGSYKDLVDQPGGEQTLADLPRDPVFDAKMSSLMRTQDTNPLALYNIKKELVSRINKLRMNLKIKRIYKEQVLGITHPRVLQVWYSKNVLRDISESSLLNENYIMNNFDENKFSFLIKTGIKKPKSRILKENMDTTFSNEGEEIQGDETVSEVSKYLNLESADDIISEVEKELQKETMERKMSKLKEIISAIDEKANSLEEDANVKEFVNPSKIKEMRRTTKKLRLMHERLTKEYAKKFQSKKEKSLNENKSNKKMSNNFNLKQFLVENKLTRSSILKEQQEVIDRAEELGNDPTFQAELEPEMDQLDRVAQKLGITPNSTPEEIVAAVTQAGNMKEVSFRGAGIKGGGGSYAYNSLKNTDPRHPDEMDLEADRKMTSGLFRLPFVGTGLYAAIKTAAAASGVPVAYLNYPGAPPSQGLAIMGIIAALFAWQVVQHSTRTYKADQKRKEMGLS